MDLRVLKYFLAVVKEGNITAAANALYLTQPNLSRQLKELEDELGKKLFRRTNHRISLTEEGLLLRNRAEEIFELVAKTKAEFLNLEEHINGDIYLGCGETETFEYIAYLAKKLQKLHPAIRFHIDSGNAQYVTDRLDKGLLDFGIVIDPVDITRYHYLDLPRKDTWGLLMRKDSPLATQQKIVARDLFDIPLICSRQLLSDSLAKNIVANWLGETLTRLNIVATYNLIFNATIFVRTGIGYAICLDKLANTSDHSELCFRPFYPRLESGLNFIWKKEQIFSKASELFLNHVRALFK